LLMASLAFVLLGCSDNSSPIEASTDQALSSSSSPTVLAKGGVRHSVTGTANTYNITVWSDYFQGFCIVPGPKEKGGFYNVFTLHAIEHHDGTFSGSFVSQFQGKVPPDQAVGFSAKVEGKVIQLMVDETGNMAKVVGEITRITGVPLPQWFVIVLVDKGEGNAPENRDRASSWWWSDKIEDRDLWLAQTPQEYVNWEWNILKEFFPDMGATIPIDNGNIQVR
jgi:hypothetical protein